MGLNDYIKITKSMAKLRWTSNNLYLQKCVLCEISNFFQWQEDDICFHMIGFILNLSHYYF